MMMDAIAQLAWNASTIALLPPNPHLGNDYIQAGSSSQREKNPGGPGAPPLLTKSGS